MGATLTKDGSSTVEVSLRIAEASAAMARLTQIWKSGISFITKHRLYRSLMVSIILYGCESWTLLADTEKRIQAFENKYLRKLLGIRYWEYKTIEHVLNMITSIVGPEEALLETVRR